MWKNWRCICKLTSKIILYIIILAKATDTKTSKAIPRELSSLAAEQGNREQYITLKLSYVCCLILYTQLMLLPTVNHLTAKITCDFGHCKVVIWYICGWSLICVVWCCCHGTNAGTVTATPEVILISLEAEYHSSTDRTTMVLTKYWYIP